MRILEKLEYRVLNIFLAYTWPCCQMLSFIRPVAVEQHLNIGPRGVFSREKDPRTFL